MLMMFQTILKKKRAEGVSASLVVFDLKPDLTF